MLMDNKIGPLRRYDEKTQSGPFALLVRGWDVEDGMTVLLGPFATFDEAVDAGNYTSAPSAVVIPLISADTYWPGKFQAMPQTPAADPSPS